MLSEVEECYKRMLGLDTELPKGMVAEHDRMQLLNDRVDGGRIPIAVMASIAARYFPSKQQEEEEKGTEDVTPSKEDASPEAVNWNDVPRGTPVSCIYRGKKQDGILTNPNATRPGFIKVRIVGRRSASEIPVERVELKNG